MKSNYFFYKIFHYQDFLDTGLVSRSLNLELDEIGFKDILIVRGGLVSMYYEGVLVSINMNDQNPFEFDGYAAYLHSDGYVYLGIDKDLYAS